MEGVLKMKDLLSKLSGTRLFAELRKFFNEEDVAGCFELANEYGLLKIVEETLPNKFEKDDIVFASKIICWLSTSKVKDATSDWQLYTLAMCSNLE